MPVAGAVIDGAIARVPGGDWAALDQREAGYDRIAVQIAGTPVAVYSIAEGRHGLPDAPRHILLSYVDVVAQGFLRWFGEDGLARFFDTTDGWDAPIVDDRALPLYPRHQRLNPADTTLIDRHLARVTAR